MTMAQMNNPEFQQYRCSTFPPSQREKTFCVFASHTPDKMTGKEKELAGRTADWKTSIHSLHKEPQKVTAQMAVLWLECTIRAL